MTFSNNIRKLRVLKVLGMTDDTKCRILLCSFIIESLKSYFVQGFLFCLNNKLIFIKYNQKVVHEKMQQKQKTP